MAKSKSGTGLEIESPKLMRDFTNKFKQESNIDEENIEKENKAKKNISIDEPTPVEDNKPKSEKKPKKIEEEKTSLFAVYLLDEEDRIYLRFKSASEKLSMSDFFWKLVTDDEKKILENKKTDVTDENHELVRKTRTSISTTVKSTQNQRELILKMSGKRRLSKTQYAAYVVHMARLNDKTW